MSLLGDERHIDLSPEELEQIVEIKKINEENKILLDQLKKDTNKNKTELKASQKYKGEKYGLKF